MERSTCRKGEVVAREGDLLGEEGVLLGEGEVGAMRALTYVVVVFAAANEGLAPLAARPTRLVDELRVVLARSRAFGRLHGEARNKARHTGSMPRLAKRVRTFIQLHQSRR